MTKLHDIAFKEFDWQIAPGGDLAWVEELASFRDLLLRWLLTSPAEEVPGITDEEMELRRLYKTDDDRASEYDPPAGDRMNACLPWAPTWGAGIKRFQNLPITRALVVELQNHIRAGLATLEGVVEVISVSVSAVGEQLTIALQLRTEFGTLTATYQIPQ
ncbi:hypothetical protein IT570_03495 [Candidatus Sumerlaeota bacterium]|nr:hypothetical protein [Candidatus Sumerlaeota bacterium]